VTTKSVMSRSTAAACYDKLWNSIYSAASANNQFWNIAIQCLTMCKKIHSSVTHILARWLVAT